MLTLIAALSGTFIGALSTIIITLINKKAEEKKHFRETVMKVAVEDWKTRMEAAKDSTGRHISTIEHFIIYTTIFFERFDGLKKIKKGDISKLLEEVEELNQEAIVFYMKKLSKKM